MLPTLANQTISRVSTALDSGANAGMTEIIELIQQLSNNSGNTTVQDLADMIGKDMVVTARVITAANTLGFNPTGVEVSTISQAIHVIGFNKIRQLALSLLLIENAERSLNPYEKREIAALALCSGIMAESIMSDRDTHSGEQAFICASLRNYGRLLMTTFMLDEYRQVRAMSAGGISEDLAFEQIFGLTPLELGHHLLESAHLPDPILKSLRALPPDVVKQAAQSPDLELLILSDLSVKLGELALRTDLSVAEFERAVSALAARSGRVFGLDVDALLETLGKAGTQLTEFARTFGLTALAQQVTPRIKARASRKEVIPVLPPPSAASTAPIPLGKTSTTTTTAAPVDTPNPLAPTETAEASAKDDAEAGFQRAFDSGIEQLASLLEDQPINMSKVYRVALNSALLGFSSRDGMVFHRETPGTFAPILGAGALFDAVKGKSLIKESDRNVFGISLQRLEDVFIYDAADPRIVAHIPPWMQVGKLAAFVILPIHDNKKPFAVLLAGWTEKKTKAFTVAQLRQVRSMLKLVGTAHRLSGQ